MGKRGDRFQQFASEVGQLIFDARRNCRELLAYDEAIALQTSQGSGEHFLRDAADGLAQFAEAQATGAKLVTTRTVHLSPTR